jgi:hypothetical protein
MAKRRTKIGAWFSPRLVEMLESPAYRVLSLSAHRALSRIEIELRHHAGNDNGRLPVTFDDFEEYGLNRHAIRPALAELEILGFITITERGTMAKAAEYRRSNRFRLTTLPELEGVGPEGCRWRRFKTLDEAFRAAEAARKSSEEKNKSPVRETHRKPVRKTHAMGKIASAETSPHCMAENAPLSISRRGLSSPSGSAPSATGPPCPRDKR